MTVHSCCSTIIVDIHWRGFAFAPSWTSECGKSSYLGNNLEEMLLFKHEEMRG